MLSRTPASAAACFESLESRRLFAGNVTVALDPLTHALSITGDNKANQILITANTVGTLFIQGLAGTTISGPTSFGVLSFVAVHVDMGNGSDVVRFESPSPISAGHYFIASVDVTTGNGDDTVVFDSLTFEHMAIDTGNGADHVSVGDTPISPETLDINLGNGADSITFLADAFASAPFDVVHIDGGNGKDTIHGIDNLVIFEPDDSTIVGIETIV